MKDGDAHSLHGTHGDVLTAVSEGMVALLKEYYGRGPTRARSARGILARGANAARGRPGVTRRLRLRPTIRTEELQLTTARLASVAESRRFSDQRRPARCAETERTLGDNCESTRGQLRSAEIV